MRESTMFGVEGGLKELFKAFPGPPGRAAPRPDSVPILLAALSHLDPAVRRRAVQMLGRIDADTGAALSSLVGALADPDARVREDAADVLVAIGVPAVNALVPALKNSSPALRRGACEVLGRLGQSARGAVPTLVGALGDAVEDMRWVHARALGQIAPAAALPPLLADLAGRAAGMRRRAATEIGMMGPEAVAAIRPLVAALADADDGVRAAAAWALGRLGPLAGEVAGDLWSAVGDPFGDVRRAAAAALGAVGGAALPLLAPGLASSDAAARRAARIALRAMGARAAPALAAALVDLDITVRRQAAAACAVIGPAPPAVLRAMMTALDDPEVMVRIAVVDAATRIGLGAMPVLRRGLQDGRAPVRLGALAGLDAIGRLAVPILTAALRSRHPDVVSGATTALGHMGAAAASVVPLMAANLTAPSRHLRRASADALAAVGAAGRSVLVETLGHRKVAARRQAAAALARLGEAAPVTADALMAVLRDTDPEVRRLGVYLAGERAHAQPATTALGDIDAAVRRAAVEALGRIGRRASGSVPALVALAGDRTLRPAIARTLAAIGPAAPGAPAALRDLLGDRDPTVRAIAAETLGDQGSTVLVLPALAASLHDRDDDVCDAAARSLARAGAEAVPLLAAVLWDRTALPSARSCAVAALAQIGDESAAAILTAAFEERAGLQDWALDGLAELGRRAAPAVAALVAALRDKTQPHVRETAAYTLGGIGRSALGAQAALQVATGDWHVGVRRAARIALEKVAL